MNGLGAHCVWLSGMRYCGCSAEAAVLPLIQLVSSEHMPHAPFTFTSVFSVCICKHVFHGLGPIQAGQFNLENDMIVPYLNYISTLQVQVKQFLNILTLILYRNIM